MGAVKNAMQRDGLDPTILDLDPQKSLESQRPSEQEKKIEDVDLKPTKELIGDKSPSVWSSRVGYPSEWQALPDKGKILPEFPALDEALYEMNSSMDSFGGGRKEVQPPLNKDPVYAKYYRMLKMVSSLHDGPLFKVLVLIANVFSYLCRDYQWAQSRMQFKEMS